MILLRNFGRGITNRLFSLFCGWSIVLIFLLCPTSIIPYNIPQPQKLLKEIHDEVVELGAHEDPDFIKREFWIDLDGQEDNKEEHVVVMRYSDGVNLKMVVQVTYFSEDKEKKFVRFAKETKLVQCCIKQHELEIDSSDYNDKEMEKLFNDILSGIRNKKELLRLIKY
jgi:hypothetical protein